MTAQEAEQHAPGCPAWCTGCQADSRFPEDRLHMGDEREIRLSLQPLDHSPAIVTEDYSRPAESYPVTVNTLLQQGVREVEPYIQVWSDRNEFEHEKFRLDSFDFKLSLDEAETHARHLLDLVAAARSQEETT